MEHPDWKGKGLSFEELFTPKAMQFWLEADNSEAFISIFTEAVRQEVLVIDAFTQLIAKNEAIQTTPLGQAFNLKDACNVISERKSNLMIMLDTARRYSFKKSIGDYSLDDNNADEID